MESLTIDLLLREPFFGLLLSALPKRATTAVDDLALGLGEAGVEMWYNPDWRPESDPVALGRARHELLHLVFGHPAGVEEAVRPFLFQVAADLVVNEYLAPEERSAEEWRAADFAGLSLTAGGSVSDYYRILEESWRRGEPPGVVARLEEAVSPADPALRRHRFWRQGMQPLSVPQRRLLAGQMAGMVRDAARASGQPPPAQWLAWEREIFRKKSSVDWRRAMRLFAGTCRRSLLRHTIRRPSKRYGTTPGLRLQRQACLLVALDTSASVAPEVLEQFFAEIDHLWRREQAEIQVLECDEVIRREYPYRGRRPQTVAGRGGTSFDPVLRRAGDHYRPDGLIYFTDGLGPPPGASCRSPLLWVIAGQGGAGHLPGKKCFIGEV